MTQKKILLTGRYKRFSLVWVSLVTMTLGVGITLSLSKVMIERDVKLNGHLIATHLNQNLRASLFLEPRAQNHTVFKDIFEQLKNLTHVEHIKFFSLTGNIIWSDIPRFIGTRKKPSAALLGALQGEFQAHYEHIKHAPFMPMSSIERWFVPWIHEIYMPIRGGTKQVVGAVEIYRIPRFLIQELLLGLAVFWAILLLAGGCYLLLTNRLITQISGELLSCEVDLEKSRRLATVGECVSMIVHDTRNLLASIRFVCEQLKCDRLTAEQRIEMVQRVKIPLEMSFAMMEDLLGFVSGKNIPLHCQRYNLGSLITSRKDLLCAMVDVSGHQLDIRIPHDLTIYCDAEKLLHMLTNLTRNSTEAMEKTGTITITAKYVSGGVQILLQDTGKGIPDELLPNIFEPFTSEHGKERPGLGLAIIQYLTKRHGGNITAANRPASGAEFRLFFPDQNAGQTAGVQTLEAPPSEAVTGRV